MRGPGRLAAAAAAVALTLAVDAHADSGAALRARLVSAVDAGLAAVDRRWA